MRYLSQKLRDKHKKGGCGSSNGTHFRPNVSAGRKKRTRDSDDGEKVKLLQKNTHTLTHYFQIPLKRNQELLNNFIKPGPYVHGFISKSPGGKTKTPGIRNDLALLLLHVSVCRIGLIQRRSKGICLSFDGKKRRINKNIRCFMAFTLRSQMPLWSLGSPMGEISWTDVSQVGV